MIGVDEVSYASASLPDLRRQSRDRRRGVGRAGPQRRHLAGVLRRAERRVALLDHRRVDRHVRRLRESVRAAVPDAAVAFDPFHVVQLGGKAADQVRRDEYNRHGRSSTGEGKWIKGARYSLLKDTANQTTKQLLKLAEVVLTNKPMYRAFLLLGELRYLYRLPKDEAADRLDAWLAWASRSKLKPFVKLARTIRQHKSGVLAAIELGDQQRTPRSLEQPRPADQPPRPRVPLSRRTDRDDLPLLRRHPDRRSLTNESPPNRQESRIFRLEACAPRCERGKPRRHFCIRGF